MTEFNKRKHKLDKVHGSSIVSDESVSTSVHETVIEIEQEETRHLLAHDSLAQVWLGLNVMLLF